MKLEKFKEKFKESYNKKEFITIFCRCDITYSGRAEAKIAEGDRMLSIKQDGVIIVHQPEGGNPINYMKIGGVIELQEIKKGEIFFKAYNPTTKEHLELGITKIYNFINKRMNDGQKQIIAGTEADMSDMIRDNPSIISKNFKPLSREEHTKHGFIDVFGHDDKGSLIIIECKRYTAGLDAIQQLRRYVEKMREMKGIEKVEGVIASPKIAPNAEEMAREWGFKWVMVEPPMRLLRHNKDQKSLIDF